jgi:hypothetical protein
MLLPSLQMAVKNFADYLFIQMFCAGAPVNVRHHIAHKRSNSDYHQWHLQYLLHRSYSGGRQKVMAILAEVSALRPQPKSQQWQQYGAQQNNWGNNWCNYNQRNNQSNRLNSGSGSNGNWNSTSSIYCKIMGHRQQECCKQIKPCFDLNVKPFWPKVNATTDLE